MGTLRNAGLYLYRPFNQLSTRMQAPQPDAIFHGLRLKPFTIIFNSKRYPTGNGFEQIANRLGFCMLKNILNGLLMHSDKNKLRFIRQGDRFTISIIKKICFDCPFF